MKNIGLITERTLDELMNHGFTLVYLEDTGRDITMSLMYKDSAQKNVVSLEIVQGENEKRQYYFTNRTKMSEDDWLDMTTTDQINEFEHSFESLAYFARVIRPAVVKILSEEGLEEI